MKMFELVTMVKLEWFCLYSECHLRRGEGPVVAHLQRFAGVGQFPGTSAYSTEFPLQTDWKLSERGQFWQCSKPALHQVCNVVNVCKWQEIVAPMNGLTPPPSDTLVFWCLAPFAFFKNLFSRKIPSNAHQDVGTWVDKKLNILAYLFSI